MRHSPRPVFGRRNLSPPTVANAATLAAAPSVASPADNAPDHAAFFTAVRAELSEGVEDDALVVPRSLKGAWLTGLVAGCALAGFNVTSRIGNDHVGPDPFQAIAIAFGAQTDTTSALPATILMGLFAGARVAAATVLCVHAALAATGLTSRFAYACGGALASAGFASLMQVAMGHPPAHGWMVELMAGSGAGLCYRALAGAYVARRLPKPAP